MKFTLCDFFARLVEHADDTIGSSTYAYAYTHQHTDDEIGVKRIEFYNRANYGDAFVQSRDKRPVEDYTFSDGRRQSYGTRKLLELKHIYK